MRVNLMCTWTLYSTCRESMSKRSRRYAHSLRDTVKDVKCMYLVLYCARSSDETNVGIEIRHSTAQYYIVQDPELSFDRSHSSTLYFTQASSISCDVCSIAPQTSTISFSMQCLPVPVRATQYFYIIRCISRSSDTPLIHPLTF
jgi:hypothetical protein